MPNIINNVEIVNINILVTFFENTPCSMNNETAMIIKKSNPLKRIN